MARKKQPTLEQIDTAVGRWQSKLKRAVNAIERLQKQRKRIDKLETRKAITREIAAPPPPASPPVPAVADDIGIPAFLQRKKLEPAAAQIVAEQAETKRKKAQGRIAKMKAKQSGETRKMPLTGKAALAAIRNP